MRKILAYALAAGALAAGALTGCIRDRGSYDYSELRSFYVDTAGLAKVYDIAQFDKLNIDPQLVYDGDKSELSYVWRIYPEEMDYAFGQITDTLSVAEVLDDPIIRTSDTYVVEFCATENATGRRVWHQWQVKVASSTGTGLLVFYDKAGTLDCDMIRTPALVGSQSAPEVVRNVYTRRNDYRLQGKPVCAGMYAYYTTARYIYLMTDCDAVKLSPDDLGVIEQFDQMFYAAPKVVRPQGYYGPMAARYDWNDPYEFMVNDGQVHVDVTAYAAGDPRFASPLIGEYYAAPYVLLGWMAYLIVYDTVQRRFLTCGIFDSQLYQMEPPVTLFDFSNVGRDMIYMDYGYGLCTGQQGLMAYAIFKNPVDDGRRYMYVMDFSESSHTKYSARALIDISGCEKIAQAELFTLGKRGPVAYYAAGNNVYQILYDLDGDTATSQRAWPFIPETETITCMKLNAHSGIGLTDSALSKYLFVATCNEATGEGRVYILETDVVNGRIKEEPVGVYDGFGRVQDIVFKYI